MTKKQVKASLVLSFLTLGLPLCGLVQAKILEIVKAATEGSGYELFSALSALVPAFTMGLVVKESVIRTIENAKLSAASGTTK